MCSPTCPPFRPRDACFLLSPTSLTGAVSELLVMQNITTTPPKTKGCPAVVIEDLRNITRPGKLVYNHTYESLASVLRVQGTPGLSECACVLGLAHWLETWFQPWNLNSNGAIIWVFPEPSSRAFCFRVYGGFCLTCSLNFSYPSFWIMLTFRDYFYEQNHTFLRLHWAMNSQQACVFALI